MSKENLARPKRERKQKSKIAVQTSQSWTLKEKMDVANAILADHRLTYGEKCYLATMILYYHNTANGGLYPSRVQVTERCGVGRDVGIAATRKAKRHGYLDYEQSSGGCSHRNSYRLSKQSEKSTVEQSEKSTPTVGKIDPLESRKSTPNYPVNVSREEKVFDASPSPGSEASASKKKWHP